MDWDKATSELTKKLDPAHVRPPAKFGPKGDYLEGWHVIAEANRIFGFDGWSYEISNIRCVSERPRAIGQQAKDGWGVSYTAHVVVMVGGVARGDVGAGHGYDVDCGLAHESAIKEAVTDALKRALRTFGNPFGLALYDKSRENVGVDLPAPDYAAIRDRLMAATAKRKTKQDLAEMWETEVDARVTLKAGDKPKYDEFYAAFEKAGKAAIDDPARQAPKAA